MSNPNNMTTFPPPYAPREHAQVVSTPAATPGTSTTEPLEFSESTSAMYDSTKGESKSKCVKSAVFGDADNLWEVLWYANSGVSGGEYASLYLSCVPTPQERDQSIGNKWTRKGLWWFRFEIKSLVPDERTNKLVTLATKDAADHTFAVKTANWGWQQFAKRDGLFLHPVVQAADGLVIICTIQAQPQPPAGYWLGMGIPPTMPVSATTTISNKTVGSGGGLSAWAGGSGASGGVAGGVAAGGGVKRVVPRDLVSSIGSLLDDPLYSDVEFVFPRGSGDRSRGSKAKKIYATKKLLLRYDYFHAMFEGGFGEGEGDLEEDAEDDDILDLLADSDIEDEGDTSIRASGNAGARPATTSFASASPRAPSPPASAPHSNDGDHEEEHRQRSSMERDDGGAGLTGEEHAAGSEEEEDEDTPNTKKGMTASIVATPPIRQTESGQQMGPKKTRIVIRDAAWSTWWSLLYWIYTDIIYFAPLTSSFPPTSTRAPPGHSRTGSSASFSAAAAEASSRRDWIQLWLDEHDIGNGEDESPAGPRPVSAKAIYRLADKLDLPALKLRAFQHICSQLTAQNIPAEVFSRFSSMFEDVRKVQVAFFLKHWSEIKKSETMTQIWQQIRVGKHIGFEEVWPLIVGQLEFKQA